MAVRRLADLVQRIDHRLELRGELGEHLREHAAAAAFERIREDAVGAAAHRDVVVHVYELAREALREEAGDEQRDVPEALQAPVSIARGRRLERLGEHHDERLQPRSVRRTVVQRLRAREQRQEVDDVVLGLVLDRELLALQGCVQRVAEELPQVRDRDDGCGFGGFGHRRRPLS